jgi:hypothetical protein
VTCWGDNRYGLSTVPAGLIYPTALAAGWFHTCAIDDNGVTCWGWNSRGQSTVPAGLTNPTGIAAGWGHTCAIDDNGVTCWGRNSFGQSTVPEDLSFANLPTPGADCLCEVQNIFPGGVVANLRLGGKPTMAKALGAEFAAIDNQGSNSCPDENPGTLTAQAEVNFHVVDESGNVLLHRTETVTCINGVDNPTKFTLVFGPENCGGGGYNTGVFDIVTTVSGEAGFKERTQRIRCRP